jgi:hypothetical protein
MTLGIAIWQRDNFHEWSSVRYAACRCFWSKAPVVRIEFRVGEPGTDENGGSYEEQRKVGLRKRV